MVGLSPRVPEYIPDHVVEHPTLENKIFDEESLVGRMSRFGKNQSVMSGREEKLHHSK